MSRDAGIPSPFGPEPSQPVKSPKPVGRLQLTWTKKHLRLLAQEDGSYEWVEPSDHRVAEVRLLRDAGRVGEEDESEGSIEVVQKKKDAAKRWARHASAEMGGTWEYLLVTDEDIKASRGSWAAVRAAGH